MIDRIIEWCSRNKVFVYFSMLIFIIWSVWSVYNIPLDAIPDLSDTQVIVYAKWDRPPQIIEDQVTFPIVSSLLGTPKVKDIRAFSDYGYSYIYIIFDDNTDVYWARSRVLEYLSKVTSELPQGVKVELGPDASGIGWIYSYILYDESGNNSLSDLRTFQDWHLKYELQSVKGVSEVASIGGFTKQYQIIVNPDALYAYNIPISAVISSVKSSNQEMGARLLDITGREYMVTIKGYLKDKNDIEEVILKNVDGIPVRVKDVARVVLGPDIRRGVAEFNGAGETAGGIVVMRYNENALNVIKRVKEKLNDVKLPDGVKIISTYDRSELIYKSIDTLRKSLIQEMIVVAVIIIMFLWHFTSSIIPIITLPLAVLFSFIPLSYMRITSNIMSLGGIAIAIGDMIDAAIGVIENSHKRLSDWKISGGRGNYKVVLIDAIKEVGRPSFFSLLVI